jgi:hypothetical protein
MSSLRYHLRPLVERQPRSPFSLAEAQLAEHSITDVWCRSTNLRYLHDAGSTDVHADNNVKLLRAVLCSGCGKCGPASTRKQTQLLHVKNTER